MGDASRQDREPVRPVTIALAWCGVLSASTLPGLVARLYSGGVDVIWRPASLEFQIAVLGLLVLAAVFRPSLKTLRRPFLALLGFVVGWRLLTPMWYRSEIWTEWLTELPAGMSLAASRLQWVLPALLMGLTLAGGGPGRDAMFLRAGRWNVPVARDIFFPVAGMTWPILLVVFVVLSWTVSPLVWFLDLQPDLSQAPRALSMLPGILIGSVLNGVMEELVFRMFLLALLIPAVGAAQAIAMTGVLFGLEHCETAGIVGIALSTYTGWILAKSMIETGGCRWALIQHVLGDIPVYAVVAIERLSP